MMDLKLAEWLPVYREICADFEFSPARDEEAAQLLAGMLGETGLAALEATRGRMPSEVVLCGDSCGLSDELESVAPDAFIVAADGATTGAIGLSGGVAYDIPMVKAFVGSVKSRGLVPVLHSNVPPGDGGISVGQAAIGGQHL